jgi:hypothetical protein
MGEWKAKAKKWLKGCVLDNFDNDKDLDEYTDTRLYVYAKHNTSDESL